MKKIFILIGIIIFFFIIIYFLNYFIKYKQKQINKTIYNKYISPIIITDSLGNKIFIKKELKKIVSFSPEITEIIAAINSEKILIGRTKYCDYPEKIKNITIISDLINYNLELIIKLKPDIIISSYFINENIKNQIEKFNIPLVIIYNENNFENTFKNIKLIGKILNKSEESIKIIDKINKKLKTIQYKLKKTTKKPKVCYIIDFKNGNFVATGDTFINTLIEKAGGENIAKNGSRWTYSLEKILKQNPEIIILDKKLGKIENFIKNSFYKKLKSVKKNKIYLFDTDIITRNGPRLINGFENLTKIIHPEIMSI